MFIAGTKAMIAKTACTLTSFMAAAAAAKSLQSCPTLCDPIDGSPPGSPIPGILQARTLEWVQWTKQHAEMCCFNCLG